MKEFFLAVNPSDFESLTTTGRSQVLGVLKKHFPDAKVVLDTDAPAAAVKPEEAKSFCKEACNIAEQAAIVACNLLGNEKDKALCIALAKKAGDVCRDHCPAQQHKEQKALIAGADFSQEVKVQDGKATATLEGPGGLKYTVKFNVPGYIGNGETVKVNVHLCGNFPYKGARAELYFNGQRVDCYPITGDCDC
jgi:hypothetical protein